MSALGGTRRCTYCHKCRDQRILRLFRIEEKLRNPVV